MVWVAPLLRAFESRIRRRVSLNRLSTFMGYGHAFLARILVHVRGPRVGDLFEAQLKAGDEHPPDLYHQAYEKAANDSLRILAGCRRRQGMEPNAFLVATAPRLLALIEAEGASKVNWRSRTETIRGYERLLEHDRKKSQETLERAILVGLRFLESRGVRPAAAMGDLGVALASLSVVMRMNGNLDDALDALLLAYPLVMAGDGPLYEGLWYQRAAYLLVRLDRHDRAAEFIKDATVCFAGAAAHRDLARTLIDLGHVLRCAGQGEEACAHLRRGIRLLEPDDRIYLCVAHELLALELISLGRLIEADDTLNKACECAAGSGSLLASIQWTRARLLGRKGAAAASIEAFQTAFGLMLTHGSPPKLVGLTFEYARILLRSKNRPELTKLAAGLLRYSSMHEMVPELQEVIEDFAALNELDSLDLAELEKLRKKLPEPGSDTDDRGRLSAQPKGSSSGPISRAAGVAGLLFGGARGRVDSTA